MPDIVKVCIFIAVVIFFLYAADFIYPSTTPKMNKIKCVSRPPKKYKPLMFPGYPPKDKLNLVLAKEMGACPNKTVSFPVYCPNCKTLLIKTNYDWQPYDDEDVDYEGGAGDFTVRTTECPRGHGYAMGLI